MGKEAIGFTLSVPGHAGCRGCVLVLFVLSLLLLACSPSESQLMARAELEHRGLQYRAHDFIAKVKEGDVETVKLYLAAGMSPNQGSGWRPLSALTHAAAEGQIQVARVLLQAGADVNEEAERSGVTPLEAAAFNGHAEVAKLLINAGANVHTVGPPNEGGAGLILETAVCAFNDDSRLHSYLFEKGEIDSEAYGDVREHPKYREIRRMFEPERLDLVKALLAAGANVNVHDERTGNSAIMTSAGCGYTAIGRELYRAGANINDTGKWGITPLSIAAGVGHVDYVHFLLEVGADVNKGAPLTAAVGGNYQLFAATEEDRLEIVRLLLKAGVDVTQKDKNGKTALELAREIGFEEIERILEKTY